MVSGAQPAHAAHTATRKKPAPARTQPKQAGRIAVVRFSGPTAMDLDADEVWKIKNHASEPTEADFAPIPDALQAALTAKLVGRLGPKVVSMLELKSFQARSPLSASPSEQYKSLSSALGARYILTGSIDKLHWHGHTIKQDDYELVISSRIVDTSNGNVVWDQNLRKFKTQLPSKGGPRAVVEDFSIVQIPTVADTITGDVAGVLGR